MQNDINSEYGCSYEPLASPPPLILPERQSTPSPLSSPKRQSMPLHLQQPAREPSIGPGSLDDIIELGLKSPVDELKKTAQFINALRGATLEQSNMQPENIDHLRAADPDPRLDVTDRHFAKALRIFLSTTNILQATYDAIRSSMVECYPKDPFLSFRQVKRRVEQLTGIVPIFHDMCRDTCVGFTGPFANYDQCPICGKDRY